MKNRAWIFVLVVICGSAAALSAFAHPADGEYYAANGEEISNDEAETVRQDAVEAVETCKSDCEKTETDICNAKYDSTNHLGSQACFKKIADHCEKQCN